MAETNLTTAHEPPPVAEVAAQKIERFANFINAGVNSWINAGRLLVEMKEQDPSIFDKITAKYPGISWDILHAFENIGMKRIYPYLMLDNCPGSKKLLNFPYEKQVSLYQAKIDVVTGLRDAKPIVEKKRIQELNSFEVNRVFLGERVLSVPEQAAHFERVTVRAPKIKKPHITADLDKRISGLTSDSIARADYLAANSTAAELEAVHFKEISSRIDQYRRLLDSSEDSGVAAMEAGLSIIQWIETLPGETLSLDMWLQCRSRLKDSAGQEFSINMIQELVNTVSAGKNYFRFPEMPADVGDPDEFAETQRQETPAAPEGVVQFDYEAVDGSDGGGEENQAVLALRRILEWVWLADTDNVRTANQAMLRFATLTSLVCPTAFAQMNQVELSEKFGCTKQNISKIARAFSEEFGFDYRNGRDDEAVKNMAEATRRNWKAGKYENRKPHKK